MWNPKHLLSALLALPLLSATLAAAEPPPAWFTGEIERLAAGSGRWIADNATHRGENDPHDAYGTEWRAALDGTSLTGRLFGLIDGEEQGDFWEYRLYWHPGRGEAVIEQFGRQGMVGIGTMWLEGDEVVSLQSFYTRDGRTWQGGHRSRFEDDGRTHVTVSFAVEGDTWEPQRRDRWIREPE